MSTSKFPEWLNKKLIFNEGIEKTANVLNSLSINTVCKSTRCPNSNECFSKKSATFLILGNICTRNCLFCSVEKSQPLKPDLMELVNIPKAVKELSMEHVVITSPTRDDLSDGGVGHYIKLIQLLKNDRPEAVIEVLVPDFKGNLNSVKKVVNAGVNIFGHNLETIPRLYKELRPEADFNRSISLLKEAKYFDKKILTKSSLILGLGEKEGEVIEIMRRLKEIDCDILILGQYLRPTKREVGVSEFVTPEQFKRYENIAYEIGLRNILAEPFARSSYKADLVYKKAKLMYNDTL